MRKDICTKPELRSWIHHLVLGDLSALKAERLERHISAWPACQIEKEFFLIWRSCRLTVCTNSRISAKF